NPSIIQAVTIWGKEVGELDVYKLHEYLRSGLTTVLIDDSDRIGICPVDVERIIGSVVHIVEVERIFLNTTFCNRSDLVDVIVFQNQGKRFLPFNDEIIRGHATIGMGNRDEMITGSHIGKVGC